MGTAVLLALIHWRICKLEHLCNCFVCLQGHLVGVITNGTAVLGLGNIGALAGKPVMEGKAVLFKKFADLDAFDLEVGCAEFIV
jgi:malic enzyme